MGKNSVDTINERAYAKLNISLDVTGKRNDGYHDMMMVMQTVSICDDIRVTLNASGEICSATNLYYVPADEKNLAVKAALCFNSAVGRDGQGMVIKLEKRIPVGAGMAGGSADAAAVLRALNTLYGKPMSDEELEAFSCCIGSDVPFCVRGGTALASGRGEKLRALKDMPDCFFVVCKPDFSVSTPELFRKLDQTGMRCHPDTAGILEALEHGELKDICRRMYNVFEDVDDRRLRTVKEIKNQLLDAGALGAVMTGTGSAVFGVFSADADIADVVERLRAAYGFCERCKTVSREEVLNGLGS